MHGLILIQEATAQTYLQPHYGNGSCRYVRAQLAYRSLIWSLRQNYTASITNKNNPRWIYPYAVC